MKKIAAFLLIFFVFLNLMCGGNSKSKITIENQWVRNSSHGMNTAFFFDVKNEGGVDTLYKVASDAAEFVEIHETYEDGDMMGMRKVENIPIESNTTFSFKPRAHHIMLINLRKDLLTGDEVDFKLFFRGAGEIAVKAKVKEM